MLRRTYLRKKLLIPSSIHPGNGHLYTCGLYAWAGNRQADGGFFRVRATGKPAYLPIELHARAQMAEIRLSDPVDPSSAADPQNYTVKSWSLQRSANYGSKHIDEHELKVTRATLSSDAKTITLTIPDLRATWGMELRMDLRGTDGALFRSLRGTRLGVKSIAIARDVKEFINA